MASPRSEQGLVSIIIPSYNHRNFLPATINSVLGQSYPNIELIILDDGSTDGSVEYLRRISDPRVKFSAHANIGAHATINKGLALASGEFLAVLNSDDLYTPDRITKVMSAFQDHPDVGLIASWIECIDKNGTSLGVKHGWKDMEPWTVSHPEQSFKQSNRFADCLLMSNFISTTSNMVFRRSVYEMIGGMRNLRFAHDWDFALRVVKRFRCLLLEEPLVKYRLHGSNTISTNRRHMLLEIVWMYAVHLGDFAEIILGGSSERKGYVRLLESINLQGNDRLFWALKVYIDAARTQGRNAPEESILEDRDLREELMQYIVGA